MNSRFLETDKIIKPTLFHLSVHKSLIILDFQTLLPGSAWISVRILKLALFTNGWLGDLEQVIIHSGGDLQCFHLKVELTNDCHLLPMQMQFRGTSWKYLRGNCDITKRDSILQVLICWGKEVVANQKYQNDHLSYVNSEPTNQQQTNRNKQLPTEEGR